MDSVIEKCLRAHSFQIESVVLENQTVAVRIPDLSTLPRKQWGDWGPMAELDLSDQSGTVSIEFTKSPQLSQRIPLSACQISLKSPILATERKAYPFFMEIRDNNSSLNLKVFFADNGVPQKCLIKPDHPEAQQSFGFSSAFAG